MTMQIIFMSQVQLVLPSVLSVCGLCAEYWTSVILQLLRIQLERPTSS